MARDAVGFKLRKITMTPEPEPIHKIEAGAVAKRIMESEDFKRQLGTYFQIAFLEGVAWQQERQLAQLRKKQEVVTNANS